LDVRAEINGTSDVEWDAFVAASPGGHLLQASRWGRLKSAFGWSASRITVRAGGELIAGVQVLFRPIPAVGRVLPGSFAYAPKGPIVEFFDRQAVAALMTGLDESCRRQRAILLRVEPDLATSPSLDAVIREAGFRRSPRTIQPGSTILVDLRDEPDIWLARMSPKNRYNIRLSERKGVVVSTGSERDIAAFYELVVMTGGRDGFEVHSLDYYSESYRLFNETEQAKLFLAKHEGRLLAGLMAFACGPKAWYFYGASSNEERQRMPNYALQWAAMNWAKDKGCRSYDLWGIPDEAPEMETNQRDLLKSRVDAPPPGTLWGVYRFKRGFAGDTVRYVGAYDRPYLAWLYPLYRRFEARRRGLPA
jgi:peptidoglycan pentaglycine glycine transferase (the first glycine)